MPIAALDKDTAKLINTTQIITSPTTAIKELLENSLDANAKNIEIHLVNAGASLIEVKDDGCGISKEDATVMGLPSYTSKISSFCDLESLRSYGFRGEALTALCAVAEVTISTKTDLDEAAITYTMNKSGEIKSKLPSHRSTGTTVQVKNLFKEIPVRRQIITNARKGIQEIKSIETLVKNYALAKPSIRLNYRVDSNVIFNKPPTASLNEAIVYLLGCKTTSKLEWMEIEDEKLSAKLLIPRADVSDLVDVCQHSAQYLLLNDRPIQHKSLDKLLTKLILEGLHQDSSSKRKVIYLLCLSTDPANIDINVEPNKFSVFFKDEEYLLRLLEKNLREFYGITSSLEEPKDNAVNESICYRDDLILSSDKEEVMTTGKTGKNSNMRHSDPSLPPQKKRKIENDSTAAGEKVTPIKNRLSDPSTGPSVAASVSGVHQKIPTLNLSSDSDNNSTDLACQTTKNDTPEDTVDSLSQLPVVDLGEDFDIDEFLRRDDQKVDNTKTEPTTSTKKQSDNPSKVIDEPITIESWSKGHVNGLEDKTNVERYVKSYLQGNDSGTNSGEGRSMTSSEGCAGFLKFLRETIPQITKEKAELSIPQVVDVTKSRWKNLSSEERGYYRDSALTNTENNETTSSVIGTFDPKKTKQRQLSATDKEKNKKRMISLLEKMKNLNDAKAETLIMRTLAPWSIDMKKVTEKSQENRVFPETFLIGKLPNNMWIVRHSTHIWAVDVVRLNELTSTSNMDVQQETNYEFNELDVEKRIRETEDLSACYPIHPI